MARFTLPRDVYHGKGALEALKSFKGKRAIVCVGGGSMKRFGFLDKAVSYLQEAGMEVNYLTDEQYQSFVDKVQPMYDEYKAAWGTEIFDLATSFNK